MSPTDPNDNTVPFPSASNRPDGARSQWATFASRHRARVRFEALLREAREGLREHPDLADLDVRDEYDVLLDLARSLRTAVVRAVRLERADRPRRGAR